MGEIAINSSSGAAKFDECWAEGARVCFWRTADIRTIGDAGFRA
jgi:hypothetical protein